MVKLTTFAPPMMHASRIPIQACVRINGKPVFASNGWWQTRISQTRDDWIIGLQTIPSASLSELVTAQQHSSLIDIRTLNGGFGRVDCGRWGGPDYCLIGFGKWLIDTTIAQRRIALSMDATDPPGEEEKMVALAHAVRTRRIGLLWLRNGMCLEIERIDFIHYTHLEVIDARNGERLRLPRSDLAWWIPQG